MVLELFEQIGRRELVKGVVDDLLLGDLVDRDLEDLTRFAALSRHRIDDDEVLGALLEHRDVE